MHKTEIKQRGRFDHGEKLMFSQLCTETEDWNILQRASYLLLHFKYISEPVLSLFYLSKEGESVLQLLPESFWHKCPYLYLRTERVHSDQFLGFDTDSILTKIKVHYTLQLLTLTGLKWINVWNICKVSDYVKNIKTCP